MIYISTKNTLYGPCFVGLNQFKHLIIISFTPHFHLLESEINKRFAENEISLHESSNTADNVFQFIDGQTEKLNCSIAFPNCTRFQEAVWTELLQIPRGETRTYKQIAEQIHHPKAVRAVGTAIGNNPVSVIVPCHRVVPMSGKTIGKYRWGTDMKKSLLEREKKC